MFWVIMMSLPALACLLAWQGPRFAVQLGITMGAALVFEALVLALRQKPLRPYLTDGSALITSILMCIAIPAQAPYWVSIIGIGFAIIIAKQLYGGLGHNLFNPAMFGYAVVLIAFPKYMTLWPAFDAISQATPLDLMQSHLWPAKASWQDYRFIRYINIAWLAGGLILTASRIVDWRIPLSFLCSVLIISLIITAQGHGLGVSADFMLGATFVGAFFIASDPVTAPASPRGRLIYGALAGVLMMIIRHMASYPDGLAFAILISNATVPLIDHLLRPNHA